MKKIKVVSTRKVFKSDLKIIRSEFVEWFEDDFIGIEFLSFSLNQPLDLLLFTSQNAVESVLQNENQEVLKRIECICVGEKTKELLENNNFKVLDFAHYAEDLTQIILEKYRQRNITFFNGNLRRETLPDLFRENKINCDEIQVYVTRILPKKIEEDFDAVVFYSPSGVKSFLKENAIENQVCFCIGTTTAEALRYVTQNIVLPPKPTIDSLLKTIEEYYCYKN